MTNGKWNLKNLIGETPNEVWTRSGGVGFIMGCASLLGFNFGKAGFNPVSDIAGIFVVAVSIFAMGMGYKMRKTLHIAEHEAALELNHTEPNKADRDCLHWVKDQLPITTRELSNTPFPGDLDRDHEDLAASSTIRRLNMWVRRGELAKVGDTYDDPDKTIFGR